MHRPNILGRSNSSEGLVVIDSDNCVVIDAYDYYSGVSHGRVGMATLADDDKPVCNGWCLRRDVHNWLVENNIEYDLLWERAACIWRIKILKGSDISVRQQVVMISIRYPFDSTITRNLDNAHRFVNLAT